MFSSIVFIRAMADKRALLDLDDFSCRWCKNKEKSVNRDLIHGTYVGHIVEHLKEAQDHCLIRGQEYKMPDPCTPSGRWNRHKSFTLWDMHCHSSSIHSGSGWIERCDTCDAVTIFCGEAICRSDIQLSKKTPEKKTESPGSEPDNSDPVYLLFSNCSEDTWSAPEDDLQCDESDQNDLDNVEEYVQETLYEHTQIESGKVLAHICKPIIFGMSFSGGVKNIPFTIHDEIIKDQNYLNPQYVDPVKVVGLVDPKALMKMFNLSYVLAPEMWLEIFEKYVGLSWFFPRSWTREQMACYRCPGCSAEYSLNVWYINDNLADNLFS